MTAANDQNLLVFTSKGIYCPPADVFIDPWRPVPKALITHGHADHARWGHEHYVCTHASKPILKLRLGNINLSSLDWKESLTVNGVRFSFHPAGHIVGSAQIKVEHRGEIWVVSGDYKTEDDGLARAFHPVECHAFITESTFGLPIYKWKPQTDTFYEINQWWQTNQKQGKVSVLAGYSLGKAQRLLRGVDTSIGPVYTHGAVENLNEVIRLQGVSLPETKRVTQGMKSSDFAGSMVIAPPSALGTAWMKKFKPMSVGIASGWMTLRGTRRRRSADRGFVLSDHADWAGLNTAIEATGAERIFVTHGYTAIFARWLRDQGYDAQEVTTEYDGESMEDSDSENAS